MVGIGGENRLKQDKGLVFRPDRPLENHVGQSFQAADPLSSGSRRAEARPQAGRPDPTWDVMSCLSVVYIFGYPAAGDLCGLIPGNLSDAMSLERSGVFIQSVNDSVRWAIFSWPGMIFES